MAPQDLALMDLEWAYGAAPAIVVVGETLAQASLDRAAQSAAAARARMQVRYDYARLRRWGGHQHRRRGVLGRSRGGPG
jgi:hypothetical protein